MIQNNKFLAVIPARGGSKGVPRKNIREIAGKPLIAYTIEAARYSRYLDKIIVSSEDEEILNVAKEWGAEILVRPAELAQDDTPGIEPVLHAIGVFSGYDYVVLLQPTSPLRTTNDIEATIDQCLSHQAPSCVSVCESQETPYWMFTFGPDMKLTPFMPGYTRTRRQDLPPAYLLNGAVYVAEIEWLVLKKDFLANDTVAYVMPVDRSLDIDTENDLQSFHKCLKKDKDAFVST
ncbi:MAG: acylneuraminate cytidylyltransferase family protein [Desulfomonilaceae bacterium]